MKRLLPFVLLVACGSRVDEHAADATSDVGFDVGSDAARPPAICPLEVPRTGAPCGQPIDGQVDCTYGDEWLPSCRNRAHCDTFGFSVIVRDCPTYACPTAPANGAECPGDMHCPYPDGTLCDCDVDGRIRCFAPPGDTRCPRFAPNAGTQCDVDGAQCDYGDVGRCGWGASTVCRDGTWHWRTICVGP